MKAAARVKRVSQWRVDLHSRLQELLSLLDVADQMEIADGNNSHAVTLVADAITALGENAELGRFDTADAYYGGVFYRVEALILGAAGVPDISEAMKAQLFMLCGKAAEIAKMLDEADSLESGRPAATAPNEAAFMKGKALSAETLKGLDEGRHEAEFEASARGRNKPQFTEPLDEAIDAIIADPSLRTGFAAGLCGYLSCVLDGGIPIDIDYLHRYTYEDWAGGPNTVYDDEADGGASESEAAPTPAAADVAPSEATDATSEHPAASWVEQALAVSTLLRPVLLKDAASRPGVESDVMIMMDDVEAALSKTATTTNQAACLQAFDDADNRVGEVITAGEDFLSPLAWGLIYGIERTLEQGVDWVKSNGFPSVIDAWAATLEPGEASQAEPVFTDPTEQRLDELLTRLDACLEGLEQVGLDDHYDQFHEIVSPHFWEARERLNEHKPVDEVVSKLLLMHAALLILEPQLNGYSSAVPLVQACSALIRAFLDEDGGKGGGDAVDPPLGSGGNDRPSSGDQGEGFPSQDRIHVAVSSAAFISRLVDHFQRATYPGTMGDLVAIHEAASVIMSALDDVVEREESLRDRLEGALESASVILKDQPPAYWKNPGILRERDVGKRVVESSDAR